MKKHASQNLFRTFPVAIMFFFCSLISPFVFCASANEFVVFDGKSKDVLSVEISEDSGEWENALEQGNYLALFEFDNAGDFVQANFIEYDKSVMKYTFDTDDPVSQSHIKAGNTWVFGMIGDDEDHEILYGKASLGTNWATSYKGYHTSIEDDAGEVNQIGISTISMKYSSKISALVKSSVLFNDAFGVLCAYLEGLGYEFEED